MGEKYYNMQDVFEKTGMESDKKQIEGDAK